MSLRRARPLQIRSAVLATVVLACVAFLTVPAMASPPATGVTPDTLRFPMMNPGTITGLGWPDHTTGQWYPDPDPWFTWDSATPWPDGPVGGYSYVLDQTFATVPDRRSSARRSALDREWARRPVPTLLGGGLRVQR